MIPKSDIIKICHSLLIPNESYDLLEEIQLESIFDKGYRNIILDVDNTLISYSEKNVNLEKEEWLAYAENLGFKIFIASNNSSFKRIYRVCNQLNIFGFYFCLKPFSFGFKSISETFNIDLSKTVIIGDQLITDVIAANWCHAYSILLKPIDIKKSFIRTLQQDLEKKIVDKVETSYYQLT